MARGQPLPPARDKSRVPLLLKRPASPDAPGASLRHLLLNRWPGRLLIGTLVLKVVLWIVEATVGSNAVVDWLNTFVRVGLLVSLAYFLSRLVMFARRRFLWRVRRRLVVSYIFIGVVPALLLVAFFLFGGALMFLNVSGYLFKSGVDHVVDDARVIAQAAADEISRAQGTRAAAPAGGAATAAEARTVRAALERRYENHLERYPGLSIAYVPRVAPNTPAPAPAPAAGTTPIVAGEWAHMVPPTNIPAWVSAGGFAGIFVYTPPEDTEDLHLVARAVAFPAGRDQAVGVIVDLPLDEQVLEQIHQATGIEPGAVSLVREQDPVQPMTGRQRGEGESPPVMRTIQTGTGSKWLWNWLVFMDFRDWERGETATFNMAIRVSMRDLYQRISSAQSRIMNRTIGEFTLMFLGIIGFLFIIIEFAAFVMGLTLALSITRSIHSLFHGTERVRFGDFAHRIEVRDRDQLGELAESFNAMTANIEDLLQQAQEKRRLEEELRIAREIQMSLLPRGAMRMEGLNVTAICVPAREVGGDYYDFFPLDDKRLGVLIADVAGKGTSAALYMAELKGLMLSLSKICHSPRDLLIQVNSILSHNLDSRSFITMTYIVIDVGARTLTYARAGHTPLIQLLASNGRRRESNVLQPNGMVVGLQIDGFEAHFEALLEEMCIAIAPGDVFVLFTDGVTEAMNLDQDLFGEDRLRDIVEEHADLPSEQLRERIMREVEAFVGEADAHDDMTMILLKIEEPPA
jgi:sigma-B regulation protein RsbU (phosphoserine phosphatase)